MSAVAAVRTETGSPDPLCPICSGSASHRMTVPIDVKSVRPIDHGQIFECRRCDFGFIHPRPTADDTRSFYALDAYYTQGGTHMVQTAAPSFVSKVRSHLAWRVDRGMSLAQMVTTKLREGASIVDIGCGGGDLLLELRRRGYDVVGVERDAASLSLGNQRIMVLEGSVESLPAALPRGSYDAVVFSHVIEHIVEPISALGRASELLKPGGFLFCEVPNNESVISRRSGAAWEHLDVPRHVNFFTQHSLSIAAHRAGLEVQDVYFCGYCRYFSDSYIATEQRIYDRLAAAGAGRPVAIRNSNAASWRLLAQTAFASSRRKYDSIGIVASKMG